MTTPTRFRRLLAFSERVVIRRPEATVFDIVWLSLWVLVLWTVCGVL